jgi:hypothetical protein
MTKIIIWNGITRTDCVDNIKARHALANAAKNIIGLVFSESSRNTPSSLMRRGLEHPRCPPLFIRRPMAVLRSFAGVTLKAALHQSARDETSPQSMKT